MIRQRDNDYIHSDMINVNINSKRSYVIRGGNIDASDPVNDYVFINNGDCIINGKGEEIPAREIQIMPSSINKFRYVLVVVESKNKITLIDGVEETTNSKRPNKPLTVPEYNIETQLPIARILVGSNGEINQNDVFDLRKLRAEESPYNPRDVKITTRELGEGWQFGNVVKDVGILQEESWETKANMPTGASCASSITYQDKIYVFGGITESSSITDVNRIFDINTNTWSSGANMPTSRSDFLCAIVNNIIYCIGGSTSNGTTNKNDAYNPVTNTWSTKANMVTARGEIITFNPIVNDKIYFIGGGISSTVRSNKNEEYDSITNTWTTKANMPTTRDDLSICAVNNIIYCIGGSTSNGTTNKNEVYNPTTNTWETKTDIPVAREDCAIAVFHNKIFLFGNDPAAKSLYIYDINSDTWSSGLDSPNTIRWSSASVHNNNIYIFGGYDSSTSDSTQNLKYTPDIKTLKHRLKYYLKE